MIDRDPSRQPHDVGGLPAGPLDLAPHEKAAWEKRVDALMMLLSRRNLIRVDQMRRAIEGLGSNAYDGLGYYERWLGAITQLLIENGTVGVDELGRRMADIERRQVSA